MPDMNVILDGGMVYFRARYLRERCGLEDPHAHLFVSREMQRRAAVAYASNPAAISVSLTRFAFFTEQLAAAASTHDQFLLLGVGYDTRALWLKELQREGLRIFEIDLPDKIADKIEILRRNGIVYPSSVVAIASDLGDDDLSARLIDHGFDPSRPTAVFAEGVIFQLPPQAIEQLLKPAHLGLAGGSRITFDFWSNSLIDRRNEAVAASGVTHRFGGFPLPDTSDGLPAALIERGYCDVSIDRVRDLVEQRWPQAHRQDLDDWFIVSATVR